MGRGEGTGRAVTDAEGERPALPLIGVESSIGTACDMHASHVDRPLPARVTCMARARAITGGYVACTRQDGRER